MDFFNIHTHNPIHPETEILSLTPDRLPLPKNAIYASIGIHPWYLTEENADTQWNNLLENVTHNKVIAIGECGLDKLKGPSLTLQTNLFRKEAALAEERSLPLIIHCVKAFNELIQLKKEIRPHQPWVIHGFRGKESLTTECIRHGFHLSFGSHFQDKALKTVPIDRLLIETDEGKQSIESIYQTISKIRNIPLENLKECINKNVREVFFRQ